MSKIIRNDIILDSNKNFLILEDDAQVANIIEEFLIDIGFNGNFIYANSLKKVEDIFEKNKIDFFILDKNISGENCFTMVKKIRNNALESKKPILISTGDHDVSSILTANKLGANNYLTKPFSFEEFEKAIFETWENASKKI